MKSYYKCTNINSQSIFYPHSILLWQKQPHTHFLRTPLNDYDHLTAQIILAYLYETSNDQRYTTNV